jgi:uncharacterized protein YunC (DUF1805 family)
LKSCQFAKSGGSLGLGTQQLENTAGPKKLIRLEAYLKSMLVEQIQLEKGCAIGLHFEMQKYPLLVIRAEKGFLMCGYLNIDAAETLGDSAARVKGVRNFEDMLKAQVVEATQLARNLGIEPGMTGKEALERMF